MGSTVPRSRFRVLGYCVLCAMTSYPAAALQPLDADTPPDIYSNCHNPSVPPPTYDDFATTLAPTFWFSPDEPLLDNTPIPSALPPQAFRSASGHRYSHNAVVYYRLVHVRHPASDPRGIGHHRLPGVGTWQVPLDVLEGFTLRYFAYYPADIGSTGHSHDVEIVDIGLEIDAVTTESLHAPCYVVRIARIVGAAHGADWYSNILDVNASEIHDVILPPYILVEEGKHANAPDRNADGWFTPGYDNSRRIREAWGVRDALRNARVPARSYEATHAKDRCSDPRMSMLAEHRHALFEENARGGQDRRSGSACLLPFSLDQLSNRVKPYFLHEAGVGNTAAYCNRVDVVALHPSQRRLGDYLEKWRFCAVTIVDLEYSPMLGPVRPRSASDMLLALGYGFYEDHRLMLRLPMPGEIRFVGGWLTTRLGKNRRIPGGQVDLVYVPAASRVVDMYGSVGIGFEKNEGEWRFVQELGIVIHLPLLTDELGKPGALFRVSAGMRGPMMSDAPRAKFVFDVGLGGW